MAHYDEEPTRDTHDRCAHEIKTLEAEIERLRGALRRANADREALDAENAAAEAKLDEAREALEFYADPWRYHSPNQSMMGSSYPSVPKRPEICRDAGEHARALLARPRATHEKVAP